jgi:CRISPR/Cas system CMR subunit Cmr4 (Cas7 group RAMP superfamily)
VTFSDILTYFNVDGRKEFEKGRKHFFKAMVHLENGIRRNTAVMKRNGAIMEAAEDEYYNKKVMLSTNNVSLAAENDTARRMITRINRVIDVVDEGVEGVEEEIPREVEQ